MIQVFDSWAGELSPATFKEFSEPYLAYIAEKLPPRLKELGLERVPMIVFAKGANQSLDSICNLGYEVVGLDWLVDPADAVKARGSHRIVFQGNADPGILYGSHASITKTVEHMVAGFGGGKHGWIGNLGHGMHLCLCVYASSADFCTVGVTPFVKPDDLKFYLSEIRRVSEQ
jgi:uroporphyrinogen decarboxylase